MTYLRINLVKYSRVPGAVTSGVLNSSKVEHFIACLGNLFQSLTTHKGIQKNKHYLMFNGTSCISIRVHCLLSWVPLTNVWHHLLSSLPSAIYTQDFPELPFLQAEEFQPSQTSRVAQLTVLQQDFMLPIMMPWAWQFSQFSTHFTLRLSMRILWETLFKALLKSR